MGYYLSHLGDFDSHLLTGDDWTSVTMSTELVRFWLTSPHRRWPSTVHTWGNATTFWLTSPHRRWQSTGHNTDSWRRILTHISSPEMTYNPAGGYTNVFVFWLTSPHRRWRTPDLNDTTKQTDFDSHLLTGDDRNILISTILPDTKYPFFFK